MTDAEDEALADRAMMALRRVIDPELGYNIVDIGLIYRVEVDGAAVRVVMTTTTRGCPATDYLRGGASDAVGSAEGGRIGRRRADLRTALDARDDVGRRQGPPRHQR